MNDRIESNDAGIEILSSPDAGGLVCPNCRAEYRPGFTTCSDCHVSLVGEIPPSPTSDEEPKSISTERLRCFQHPEMDAVAKCRNCSSGVCGTCDFQVSAGLHLCPKCIDNARDEKISPRRRNLAFGALAVASYCTLFGAFFFSGALYRAMGSAGNVQALGFLCMYGLYLPSVLGTALGVSAFERRLKNTPVIRTALIWNVALTVIFVLIEIIARIL